MEENELIINDENIKNLIYMVRGKQVMLDRDLAKLYHCKNGTKTINQAVKRNIERFPERFMFQMSKEEYENLWSQIGTTLDNENQKYRRKENLPYVFTEQGVAMLSTVIRTNIAVAMSIKIMDAFVEMRKFLINNQFVIERINNIELKQIEYKNETNKILKEHEKKFEIMFNEFEKNSSKEFNQKIFFDGQIWDSYNLIVNIIKRAQNQILIIDNYIDDSILEMLSKKKKGVEAVILTSNNSNILKLDVQKFNKEYPILKIARTDIFHDRFIVIDNKELYHCGASLKDLGKKCFGINRIEDVDYIEKLNDKVKVNS